MAALALYDSLGQHQCHGGMWQARQHDRSEGARSLHDDDKDPWVALPQDRVGSWTTAMAALQHGFTSNP